MTVIHIVIGMFTSNPIGLYRENAIATESEARPERSTLSLSHSHLYNHGQQSLRFVEHPYNIREHCVSRP